MKGQLLHLAQAAKIATDRLGDEILSQYSSEEGDITAAFQAATSGLYALLDDIRHGRFDSTGRSLI